MDNSTSKKKSSWNKGIPHTEEEKRKISEANKGRVVSEETRQKIRLKNKGKTPWIKGLHHTEETKKKIGLKSKGRLHSEEAKEKNRLAHLGRTPWNKGIPMSEEQKRKVSLSKKGQKAWNKGIKGSIKPNKTSFKKGLIPYNKGKKINLEKHPNYGMSGKHHSENTKLKFVQAKQNLTNEERTSWIGKIKNARLHQKFTASNTDIEKILKGFCEILRLEYIHQYPIELPTHNHKADIYLPKYNLIIDADGPWPHQLLERQIKTDEIQNKELLEKGYKLLRIPYCEVYTRSNRKVKMTKEEFYKKILIILNMTKEENTRIILEYQKNNRREFEIYKKTKSEKEKNE